MSVFHSIIYKIIFNNNIGCQDLKKEENILNIVDRLLKNYHHCRKIDFKPNSRAVQLLLEMGFEENNIIEALKITGNNQINAVSNSYNFNFIKF